MVKRKWELLLLFGILFYPALLCARPILQDELNKEVLKNMGAPLNERGLRYPVLRSIAGGLRFARRNYVFVVLVPIIVAYAIALPGRKERHGQRVAADGSCVKCGYLLRGVPSKRCPECGNEFR